MEQLIVIKTVEEFLNLFDYIKDFDYIAYDCETTGLSREAEMIGFSVCAEEDKAYYVVLSYWDKEQQKLIYLDNVKHVKSFLTLLTTKKLIMHNAVFDAWKAETCYGVQLMPHVHTDTMILSHILDENRKIGLKELGKSLFGESAVEEQKLMHDSIKANGGCVTKDGYELYKADVNLIGKYGAKDTILTLKLFYHMVPQLFEQGLDKFFYDDESMPLLRGPTYDLNTTGLRVDAAKLQDLRGALEAECIEDKAFIHKEIHDYIKDKYPGTNKKNHFNIDAGQQLAWLLFERIGEPFGTLTDGGKEACSFLGMKIPYSYKAKRDFITECKINAGRVMKPKGINLETGKRQNEKKIVDFWKYCATDEDVLEPFKDKYKWVKRLLEYKKKSKILGTYVIGIQEQLQYNVIRPSFKQAGTTSGRYSSAAPNFQNLPSGDKRIKKCVVARSGKVFVGADYSQLEPRVFASFSKDERLMACFESGDDFYSVIGMETFNKFDCTPKKEGSSEAFGVKYKHLRNIAKVVALSATYGTTANKMGPAIGKDRDEAQEVIDNYFETFPKVRELMLESHEQAKTAGVVHNLFGRPRRMPEALEIGRIFPHILHEDLEYAQRNILNLSINHRIQSTGASIINRASIKAYERFKAMAETSIDWLQVKIVLQVHDELVVECPKYLATQVAEILKECMENTTILPGVRLEALPVIADNLADLK